MAHQDPVSDVAVFAKIPGVFHGGEENKCLLGGQDLFDWLGARLAGLAWKCIGNGKERRTGQQRTSS